jgi:hypothetical protein
MQGQKMKRKFKFTPPSSGENITFPTDATLAIKGIDNCSMIGEFEGMNHSAKRYIRPKWMKFY